MVIYSVTFPDGKTYIGKTSNLYERKYAHLMKAKNIKSGEKLSDFYMAINKYGENNIEWCVEAVAKTESGLKKLERYFILGYNCQENGFNRTMGGY